MGLYSSDSSIVLPGAEVRLSPRACADLSPGGPFDTPLELRVLLGCSQSNGCFQQQHTSSPSSLSSSLSSVSVPAATSVPATRESIQSTAEEVEEEPLEGASLSQKQRQLNNHDHSHHRRGSQRRRSRHESYMSALEVNRTEALMRQLPSLALASPQHVG